jgi:hypothetical protein
MVPFLMGGEQMSKEIEVKLSSGRDVKLGPMRWPSYAPLMGEVFRIYVDRLRDLRAVSNNSKEFMVAALYAILGDPRRWMHVASTEIATWIVHGSVREPPIPMGADRKPNFDGWDAEEVSEIMTHASELTDFGKLADQLKNSLGPVTEKLSGVPTGPENSTETGDQTNESDSAESRSKE